MNTEELGLVARMQIDAALRQAVTLSSLEPHRVYWLHAIKCPGCGRHSVAIAITMNTNPKPKYVLATVTNGQVIPRNMLRH
jgi:hypothetical protein